LEPLALAPVIEILATVCAGLFAGAAIYVSVVEHPARLECGTRIALAEFAPSYRKGVKMQAGLALFGCAAAVTSWWYVGDHWLLAGGVLLGSVVPLTLLLILPTNRRLLDAGLDPTSPEAANLLQRWGSLHAVRSVLGATAFLMLLVHLHAQ